LGYVDSPHSLQEHKGTVKGKKVVSISRGAHLCVKCFHVLGMC